MVTGVGTTMQPQTASVITSTTTMQPTVIQTPAGESSVPQRRPNDNRRSNKPIMEKRRRARINNCLNDLKTLILEAMKKDPARHSKLEKADILEMTVKHLENLQRQQAAISAAADPSAVNKFRAGFSECAAEVGRFPGLESTVKRRLLQHLANCLGPNQQPPPPKEQPQQPQKTVQLHILPQQQEPIFLTNQGVQLVQTRLPNGDIALILPTQNQQSTVPLLIPIPQQRNFVVTDRPPQQDRPSSSTSTFSNNSGYSSPGSPYEPVSSSRPSPARPTPYQRPDKPLSLVIRKPVPEQQNDEKPWRPW